MRARTGWVGMLFWGFWGVTVSVMAVSSWEGAAERGNSEPERLWVSTAGAQVVSAGLTAGQHVCEWTHVCEWGIGQVVEERMWEVAFCSCGTDVPGLLFWLRVVRGGETWCGGSGVR